MNYRHAYHAGNFADVVKHVILLALIRELKAKPASFCVFDTHGGRGDYDLTAIEAVKTREFHAGVNHILSADVQNALILHYKTYVSAYEKRTGRYPGSPALIADNLRPQDRLVSCELHPEDYRALKRLFRSNKHVSIHARDAYSSIKALLPPRPHARGLVMIDPAFEQPDEFSHVAEALAQVQRRFATGIVCAWFPIKHRAPVRNFYQQIVDLAVKNAVTLEFTLRPPLDPARLNGCGLVVINPPYLFLEKAESALSELTRLLMQEEDPQFQIVRLTEV